MPNKIRAALAVELIKPTLRLILLRTASRGVALAAAWRPGPFEEAGFGDHLAYKGRVGEADQDTIKQAVRAAGVAWEYRIVIQDAPDVFRQDIPRNAAGAMSDTFIAAAYSPDLPGRINLFIAESLVAAGRLLSDSQALPSTLFKEGIDREPLAILVDNLRQKDNLCPIPDNPSLEALVPYGLRPRIIAILQKHGIVTVGDLMESRETDLLLIPGIKSASLRCIWETLDLLGVSIRGGFPSLRDFIASKKRKR